MLCEKCQQREATVHLTGSTKRSSLSTDVSPDESFEHHFCEPCSSSEPLVNLKLRYGPDVISENLKVLSVSPERTVVRLVRTEADATPEEWSFLTSRFPQQYAVVGMEFGITCSPQELEHLKGTR